MATRIMAYLLRIIYEEGENLLKVAICDDDRPYAWKLETLLLEICHKNRISVETEVFWYAEHLLDHMHASHIFDIIFMDIEMSDGMNGIAAAKKIREFDELVLFIYVTNYKSYAYEAYDVNPFQFLLKPIDPGKLNIYFLKAVEKVVAGDYYYNYRYRQASYRILVNNILYFESRKRLVHIHTYVPGDYVYYDKLSSIEEKLRAGKSVFWRIHQSYLVNTRHIVRKTYDKLQLSNGQVLFISEERRKIIDDLYCELIDDSNID